MQVDEFVKDTLAYASKNRLYLIGILDTSTQTSRPIYDILLRQCKKCFCEMAACVDALEQEGSSSFLALEFSTINWDLLKGTSFSEVVQKLSIIRQKAETAHSSIMFHLQLDLQDDRSMVKKNLLILCDMIINVETVSDNINDVNSGEKMHLKISQRLPAGKACVKVREEVFSYLFCQGI